MVAVYKLFGIKKKIPAVSRHDIKPNIMLKGVIKSYKPGVGVEVVRNSNNTISTVIKTLGIIGIVAGIGYKFIK